MISLLALWHTYAPLVDAVGGGGILGWYGRVASVRARERRDALDAGAQALQLNAAVTERANAVAEELSTTQRAYWLILAQIQDVYAEAIAVRLIVHDLDAAAGRPLRQFRPLPPYPFPAQSDGSVAGATTAPTAEPRAENTHV